jgi:hypothetical protein
MRPHDTSLQGYAEHYPFGIVHNGGIVSSAPFKDVSRTSLLLSTIFAKRPRHGGQRRARYAKIIKTVESAMAMARSLMSEHKGKVK